uniref:DUF4005 domain-containing protein n=1 Tax=Steinernema glaseri TaxID=37863 RepID=A0A1I7Z6X2_9BILA
MGLLDVALIAVIGFIIWLWFVFVNLELFFIRMFLFRYQLKKKEDGKFVEKLQAVFTELVAIVTSKNKKNKDATEVNRSFVAEPTQRDDIVEQTENKTDTVSVSPVAPPAAEKATTPPVSESAPPPANTPQPLSSASKTSLRTAISADSVSNRKATASFRGNEKAEVNSEYERRVPRGISEERLGVVKSKGTPKTNSDKDNARTNPDGVRSRYVKRDLSVRN